MNPALASSLNVSRETFERLEHYVALLHKWNPKINLVSRGTLQDVWERHIRDSLQVFEAAEGLTGAWVDLGSGGGLPGLVVALAQRPGFSVTLVESDQRKAAFLRTVLRETGSTGTVIAERIEATEPQSAAVLSARALAALPQLLGFCERHLAQEGVALLPKGITWKNEVAEAQKSFSFHCEAIKSCTQEGAVILRIREISRV
ncbi:MAG: 16S rRNA (guanine(527)-N(7))-methyltransferase RsmG [Marinovum algicola]|jgi:16S rRNA (guanine527-N7)-methyltransferase|uniref:Ribosomal RNA small subunit methyltransferase G n=1 Tax=Marinovum algicola TaxID=42444 RepID=A0A975W9Z4_9RHOB|nr:MULTISPECIES: 16S rRNA (guanine(527)-N(7))-methyltransferase RsmG [Marinovum]MDD9738257.1 16S rRNA (guanine(527)-N(7))-methyltransferase RsmG [Marinovum sp. SP66]SEJ46792.1 16S rRNA (guanine527-N7)-methyltransferase [Marinovum algicola]SLN35440.1 Ribosomal RNA small subunit methyltransferase G [Marinovum algicola]